MRNNRCFPINKGLLVAFSMAALLALNACAPQGVAPAQRPAATAVAVRATDTATPTLAPTAPQEVARLNEAMLKNGTYELRDIGKFQLGEGKYEKATGSGATQIDRVTFVSSSWGDLNGNGIEDAAVILVAQTGGSGSFYSLVSVFNDNGTPKQAGADYLGDRIKLESMKIEQGQIVVNMLVAGPKDPLCCPSQKVTRTYAMRSGSLVLLSETVVAPTTPASAAQPLNEAELKAALYDIPDFGKAQLVAGKYERDAKSPAGRGAVGFSQATLGDLTQDGVDDAAVILWANTGGSGIFEYLAVVTKQNGIPTQVTVGFLGDRVKIERLVVAQGKIGLTMLTQGPQDPLCCPTQLVTRTYWLEGNVLKQASEPAPGAVANTYKAILPAADAAQREMTLVLRADKSCTLTTEYAGKPNKFVEKGTWSNNGPFVIVVLTDMNGKAEKNEITFEPKGDELVSTQWDKKLYGSDGLRLKKTA
jgi:hypothetical protein